MGVRPAGTAPGRQAADRPVGAMIAVLGVGALVTILDANIVNVAIEDIGRDFTLSVSEAQWISGAYLLALAFSITLMGCISDRLGTTKLWVGALAAFMGGSLLCAVAWSSETLIAARVVQGAGGGLVMPLGQAIIAGRVPPERLGRHMSMFTMPIVIGPVLGPLVGGVIVDHATWRAIFLVNVPVGLVTILAGLRTLPRDSRVVPRRLDVRGLMLLPTGIVLLVYGLSRTAGSGTLEPAGVVVAVAGFALIAAFGRSARSRGNWALIDVSLFRQARFRAATAIALLFGVMMFGGYFVLPLYLQVVRGDSALHAGLLMAPQGLGSAFIMPFAGRLVDRLGAGRVAPSGGVLVLVGTLMFAAIDASTTDAWFVTAGVLRGIGFTSMMLPSYAVAYSGLERAEVARAASAINAINRVGGSLGTALTGLVLSFGLDDLISGGGGNALTALAGVSRSVRDSLAGPLAAVFAEAMWVLAVGAVLALLAALALWRADAVASRS